MSREKRSCCWRFNTTVNVDKLQPLDRAALPGARENSLLCCYTISKQPAIEHTHVHTLTGLMRDGGLHCFLSGTSLLDLKNLKGLHTVLVVRTAFLFRETGCCGCHDGSRLNDPTQTCRYTCTNEKIIWKSLSYSKNFNVSGHQLLTS